MSGQLAVPKKICLLRLSAIGDVCHAVAMVQFIQKHWPDVEITWVIGKIEAQLLKDLPNIRFVVFDKKAGVQGYKDLRRALQGERFDALLHMQVALRASIASLMIKAKVKIGFDKERAKEGQWLFTNKRIAAQSQPHVADGFMGFAHALGLPMEKPQWQMPIAQADIDWAKAQLASDKPIAVICPAASKTERNWHSQGYAQVADQLTDKGFSVVICGGPTPLEKVLSSEIMTKAKSPLMNLVGQTSLQQLLAVLRQAHLVIAPDTGPAHMAVTVGTPVVGLYAHSNPLRTGPYLSQQYVVSVYQAHIEQQQGKSLTDIAWGTRAKGAELMNDVTLDKVTDSVERLIRDHYPELT